MSNDEPASRVPRDAMYVHREEHTPSAISQRLDRGPGHSYLRDFIYGAIDGTVTTYAIVAGVAGASLPSGVVIILGFANLFADGFSMAVSNYLGTKTERQMRDQARRQEKDHIRVFPEGEREEIRQIFARKGFAGEELEAAVTVITSDVERWVDTMVQEELGMPLEGPKPLRAALSTFVAFITVGFTPLFCHVTDAVAPGTIPRPFLMSGILTGAAFFVVGAMKARYVSERWWASGVETFLVGGVAAAVAYAVGLVLKGLAGM